MSSAFGTKEAPRGLPHVDESALLDGTVISELIEGRIVLIGPREEPGLGIFTPTTNGDLRMSRLEVHGNIVETILQDRALYRAGSLTGILCLLISTMLANLIFRQLPTRLVMRSGVLWLAGLSVVFWLSLTLASIQLPMTAIWLTSALIFIGVLKSRFQILTHFFEQWKLLRRTNIKSTWKASYQDIWSSVATSTMHIFHPNRLVILELETGSAHLAVRETVGCDPEAIVEKRRDVSRLPYRSAVELRCPASIDDRPFLDPDANSTQYMVPLISGADVQGVMILDLDRAASPERGDFKDRLSEFSDKMATFIAGTRERELEQLLSGVTMRRFRLLPESIAARALHQDEEDHRRYEDLLSGTLQVCEIGVAIYDVFGNLLTSNKRMIDHLQSRDISVADKSCVEILSALTGRGVRSCRELVRQCLIGNHIEEIMLAPDDEKSSAGVLYVKPLRGTDDSDEEGVENRCISIQFVDGTAFHDMYDWQTSFSSSQSRVLKDQMSRLEQAIKIVPDSSRGPEQFTLLAEQVLDTVEQCQSVLQFGLSEKPEDFFAVNVSSILSAALENCRDECESRGVTIRNASSSIDAQVVSNPILLRRVFAFAIDCLLDDASRQTLITIDSRQQEQRLRIRFDVVPRPGAAGETGSEHRSWEVSHAQGSKASMILLQKHHERLIEVSRWLRQWGASLNYECANSYQPSIEIDLACDETGRHSEAANLGGCALGDSVESAPDSSFGETCDA